MSHLSSEDVRSTLRFKNLAHLLKVESDTRLLNIFASISCLMIIAHVSTDIEVSKLIDMVAKIRVDKKHLYIATHQLNLDSLQNKTINYNVVFHHKGTGSTATGYILDFVSYGTLFFIFTDGKNVTTSLCPVLGQTHGQTYNGLCPGHFQTPYGKELKISFIGIRPYINYDPIGGTEFLIVKILAEKFKFTPKFIPEKAVDNVDQNGKFYGLLHRVRCMFVILFTRNDTSFSYSGLHQAE